MARERTRVPPSDLLAEDALLGAMLYSQTALNSTIKLLKESDFYKPSNRRIFSAIHFLWEQGDPVDALTVYGVLDEWAMIESVGGPAALISLQANSGVASAAPKYAERVVKCAAWRRLIGLCYEFEELAYEQDGDPSELADLLGSRIGEIHVATIGDLPSGLTTIDDFLDRPAEDRPSWVIPGLLRVGWRAMVVAAEGVGKTVLFRQMGMAVAQGIHPLHFAECEPQRVLIVDLENPDDSIIDVCEPIRVQTLSNTKADYDPDRAWLWHQPGGIDLRMRRDRSDLESVIAHVRPTLVCLGPIYKAYNVTAKESDELAASEVMAVFDDLRTRYGFALLLEHHAPKGMGKSRELMPYGSSLWLRWPEIGLKLQPKTPDGTVMEVGRWRGDRLENSWPIEIERSQGWPWRGVWPTGAFTNGTVPTTARRDPMGPQPRDTEEALRNLPEPPRTIDEPPPGIDPATGEVLDRAATLFDEEYASDEIPF